MDEILNVISVSAITGLIASIATTFLTNRYNRKNIRTAKFIETISTERIKWIENVRADFSILITSLLILKHNKKKFHNIDFESQRVDYVRHLAMVDDLEDSLLEADYYSSNLINDFNNAFNKCLTPAEIVIKSTQLRLRLSSKEPNSNTKRLQKSNHRQELRFTQIQKEICDILETIIDEYSIIDFDFNNSKIDINELSKLTQEMLTGYWNNILDEVKTK